MTILARGQPASPTDQVILSVSYTDIAGNPVNTDSLPQVSIASPTGLVQMTSTSVGVSQTGVGTYQYIYTVGINANIGIYRDSWLSYINGFRILQSFEFVVLPTQVPSVNVDGYIHLGDDANFNYSQQDVFEINKLLKSLKARLNSSGKAKSADAYGNVIYVDCDIFSVDMLVTFLATALWDFNQVPFFTSFRWSDPGFVEQFGEILVEGATLYALAGKSLIEAGREFQITDSGIQFQPPSLSSLMMSQYSSLLTAYFDRLKFIKNSIRPKPLGLSTFGMTSSINPIVRNLRLLRERRII